MTADEYKKHNVIQTNLDRIVDDLMSMVEQAYGVKLNSNERDLFKAKTKSILYYWLSNVYDEASSEVKNLELALETSKTITRTITRQLRDSEETLRARIAPSVFVANKHNEKKDTEK